MLRLDLPITDYLQALEIQRKIVERQISRGGPDVLILLEHHATITLGTRGDLSHLVTTREVMEQNGIPVYRTDRGGEATYHGPGQLVAYPILNLKRRGLSVKAYVSALEETIIRSLACFQVAGFRIRGKPGVWTGSQEKIASIGVRIRHRVTYHGFSLNVSVPIDPCQWVISCGMPDVRMVNLSQYLDVPVGMQQVRDAVAGSFSRIFNTPLRKAFLQEAIESSVEEGP